MPDSVEDLIRRAAAKHGVDEKLALAVAEQESGFNPTLTNKDSGATGTFQLLPTTGTMLGVDPTDPRQNIDGGVKYLRQLMDRHKGDLDRVLRDYGGVKTSKGDFYSPEVQTRIDKFRNLPPLADLTPTVADTATGKASTIGPGDRAWYDVPVDQPERPSRPVGSELAGAQKIGPGRGPVLDTLNTGWQTAKRFAIETFDPRTPEGAINLMGTIGGISGEALAAKELIGTGLNAAGAYAKKGVGNYLKRNALPAIGAGTGGTAAELYNQQRAGQPTDLVAAAKTGAAQAGWEYGGELIAWPIRQAGKLVLAHPIAKYAKAGLDAASLAARDAGQELRYLAGIDVRNATAATQRYARTLKAGAVDTAVSGVQAARDSGTTGVQAAATKKAADIVAAREAKATLIAQAKTDARAGLRAARVAATQKVAGVAEEGASQVAATQAAAQTVKGAARAATSQGPAARVARVAETKLTEIETQGLHDLAQAEDAWRTLQTAIPDDVTATGEAVREVVRGRPGVLPRAGEDKTPGAVTSLLRQAGEDVRESTRSYVEPVDATAIREDVTQRYLNAQPSYVRAGEDGAADDLGEVVTDNAIAPSAPPRVGPKGALTPAEIQAMQAKYPGMSIKDMTWQADKDAILSATIGPNGESQVTEQTLPGVLRLISAMPDQVSFEDLHVVKTLLDATVNWERSAKRPTEQVAKGARGIIRGALAKVGHAPYEAATETYQRLMDTQRDALVKKVIGWVGKNADPAKVVTALNPENPQGAAALHDLLVRQSAAGGNAQQGQKAWDLLASAYTHRTLLQGDPSSLLSRLHTLEGESPEFAALLFSGPAGLTVRGQLEQVGQITANAQANYVRTLSEAGIRGQANVTEANALVDRALRAMRNMTDEEIEAVRVAGTKQIEAAAAAGNADLAAAKASGTARVDAATTARARAVAAAKRAGTTDTRDVTETIADARLSTQHANAATREAARKAAQDLADTASANVTAFAGSTLGGRWKADAMTQEAADVVRVLALFPNNFGMVAAARLLMGPHRADLLQYMAYSPKGLQTFTKMVASPHWDRGWAGVLRTFANQTYGPKAQARAREAEGQAQAAAAAEAATAATAATPAAATPP